MLEELLSRYKLIKPRAAHYLAVFPVVALAMGLYLVYAQLKQPPYCSSRAKIAISGKINLPETANAYREELTNFLGTQIEILGSEELANKARRKMQLDHLDLPGSASVKAHYVTGTTIIQVEATGLDPQYVPQYLQAILDEYIEFRSDRRIETTNAALRQIREEIPRTERQVALDEEALFKFKQQHNMRYWDAEASGAGQLLSQLRSREANLRMQLQLAASMKGQAVTQAREGRLQALGAFDETQKHAATTPADPVQSAELDNLQEQLMKLQVEREQLLTTFKPKHPRVEHVDQEIQKQSRLIQLITLETERSFDQNVAGMQSELSVITQAIAECERKALEAAHAAAEYERLESNLALSKEVHTRLVSGLQNVDVSREVNLDMVQILEHPTPASPLPKNLTHAAINGLLLGGIIGFAIIMGLQKLDQRAFSADEIAEAAGAAIVAEIPPIDELADPSYRPTEDPQPFLLLEAMRSLAASLPLSSAGATNHSVILCCSSTPSEGKSTLALHLALYLENLGFNTLLVDADLRRGCIGETLGLDPQQGGLAEGLEAGRSGWLMGIHRFPDRKLSILPRGNPTAQTIDLLSRGLSQDLFAELKASYDAIVIDSSPLIPVSDSISFLPHADHILLIGRVRVTKLDLLKKATAIIRHNSRHGFRLIANGLKGDSHMYGYGYQEQDFAGSPDKVATSQGPAV